MKKLAYYLYLICICCISVCSFAGQNSPDASKIVETQNDSILPTISDKELYDLANTSVTASRDPTKPLIEVSGTAESSTQGPLNLQSILIASNRRLVMINGEVYSIGSHINGAQILAISRNSVILSYNGRKVTVYLFGKRLWTTH